MYKIGYKSANSNQKRVTWLMRAYSDKTLVENLVKGANLREKTSVRNPKDPHDQSVIWVFVEVNVDIGQEITDYIDEQRGEWGNC